MLNEFILSLFSEFGAVFCVVFFSCLPILETKVAIPLGINKEIWGENALSLFASWGLAFLSSFIVGLLFCVILKAIFKRNKKKKKVFRKMENFLNTKGKKFLGRKRFSTIILLTLFVGLPVPFSGLFTGAILCAILDLKFFECFVVMFFGNLLDCTIIFFVCLAFGGFVDLLLTVILILISLILVYKLFEWTFLKIREKSLKKSQ